MEFKQQSDREHLQLLEACKAKDITRAKKLLKQHMQKAGKQLAAFLRK
jgi:DNA-binding GntR family transcriptional regulator